MVLWMTPSLVYAVKASKRNDDDGSFMSWLGLVCFSSLELVYFRRELEKHLKIGKLPRLLFISIITTTFTEIFLVRELSVSLYLKYLEVPVWRHDTMYFYKIFSLYFANFCANVRNLYKNYFSTRRNFLSEGSRHFKEPKLRHKKLPTIHASVFALWMHGKIHPTRTGMNFTSNLTLLI